MGWPDSLFCVMDWEYLILWTEKMHWLVFEHVALSTSLLPLPTGFHISHKYIPQGHKQFCEFHLEPNYNSKNQVKDHLTHHKVKHLFLKVLKNDSAILQLLSWIWLKIFTLWPRLPLKFQLTWVVVCTKVFMTKPKFQATTITTTIIITT